MTESLPPLADLPLPGGSPADALSALTPTAEGTFGKTPLAQVLVYMLERKLTGTLEARQGPGGVATHSALLFLSKGVPVKARLKEPLARLGTLLVARGAIDEGGLKAGLDAAALQKVRLGEALLSRGSVSREVLEDALNEQIARRIDHVAGWPKDARYAYFDTVDALEGWGAEVPGVAPLSLVWRAFRRRPPDDAVRALMLRVGRGTVRLSRSANGNAALEALPLTPEERAAVARLAAGPLRLSDLATTVVENHTLGLARAELLVYGLLLTKQIEIAQAAPVDAKKPEEPSAPAAVAVARVQLQQLPQKGFVEDRAPPSRSSRVDPRIASPLPPAEAVPSEAAPVSPALLTPQHAARKREVLERVAALPKENYFTMLGVRDDAPLGEVQAAFLHLAKQWHPDRLPGPLAEIPEVKAACARVFSHLSDAHQTLTDPERRPRYMRLLHEGGATPEDQAEIVQVLGAATNFQKAEICVRLRDFPQAEDLCRRAHEADPKQADYLALLAWIEALKPENQAAAPTQARIEMLTRALDASPRCERAFYYRGMLYKRLQQSQLAAADFRKSSELNPRNIDAIREVRLFEMRKAQRPSRPPRASDPGDTDDAHARSRPPGSLEPSGKGPAAGLGKLLGRIFKK